MRAPLQLTNRLSIVLHRLTAQLAPAASVSRAPARVAVQAPVAESRPVTAALFAEALRANSNLELDWLWLATRVSSNEERRHCYLKALAINSESVLALEGLRSL